MLPIYGKMALSFIALRLNVTPETVDASHALLLKMVKPASQNELKIIFAEEANKIKKSNVNSGFPDQRKSLPIA